MWELDGIRLLELCVKSFSYFAYFLSPLLLGAYVVRVGGGFGPVVVGKFCPCGFLVLMEVPFAATVSWQLH